MGDRRQWWTPLAAIAGLLLPPGALAMKQVWESRRLLDFFPLAALNLTYGGPPAMVDSFGRDCGIVVAARGVGNEAGVGEQKVVRFFSPGSALFDVWSGEGEGAVKRKEFP